ncbi:MAG: transaldolase family protein, partial [Sphingomicrobium sp.]
MMDNRLRMLEVEGQAIWLDFLERSFLLEGDFTKLIEQDGLTGITSNPSIFEKAIVDGSAYNADIADILAEAEMSAAEVYERLAVSDLQTAADALRPAYERLNGADGFASIEVSPHLAYSTQGSVEEARRLWTAVDRPNLMVKIPGT